MDKTTSKQFGLIVALMIDPVIVMKLVREKITGVAKKEARDIPGFGKLFQFAGVQRFDHHAAIAVAVLAKVGGAEAAGAQDRFQFETAGEGDLA